MEPKQKLEEFAAQQPDRYRYYITNEALQKGTCPHMEDMKLVEIAERTGFASQHYFSRVFKEKIGFSPADYRQYIRKSPEGKPE